MHVWIRKWDGCTADGSTDADGVFDTCRSCCYQFVIKKTILFAVFFFPRNVRSWYPACCKDEVIDAWSRPELNMGERSWKQGVIFCFDIYLVFFFQFVFSVWDNVFFYYFISVFKKSQNFRKEHFRCFEGLIKKIKPCKITPINASLSRGDIHFFFQVQTKKTQCAFFFSTDSNIHNSETAGDEWFSKQRG